MPVLDKFLEQTLMGRDSGDEQLPAVFTQGRNHDVNDAGFLDLRYRRGLGSAVAMPAGEPTPVTVTFKNQDWTVEQGHRIALVIESSNSAWAVSDTPGLSVDVASRSSRLVLPVAP